MNEAKIERWRKLASGRKVWSCKERSIKMASYIKPGASVLDIGAGSCAFGTILPKTCEYQPLDYTNEFNDNTIVMDLDDICDLPQSLGKRYDVGVMSGLLEHVRYPAVITRQALVWCDSLLVSYCDKVARKEGYMSIDNWKAAIALCGMKRETLGYFKKHNIYIVTLSPRAETRGQKIINRRSA